MRNPPILISVIGFFAALAGFAHLFFGLRVLGFDWFGALGDLPALLFDGGVAVGDHAFALGDDRLAMGERFGVLLRRERQGLLLGRDLAVLGIGQVG